MSITDELREWFKDRIFMGNGWQELQSIADRIDAEHETTELQKESYRLDLKAANIAVGEAYKRGFDEGFASADDWLGQHESDMAEHGWIRLPKDADGEYIRIGDEVEEIDYDGHASVFELRMAADGWRVGAGGICRRPDSYRHCHGPTVEDVLEELLREYDRDDSELTNGEIVEMFAKRLQLREDAC